MTDLIVPVPKADVSVRDATLADIPFIDGLQKLHRNQLGFMPETWLVTKIGKREVIVAEEVASGQLPVASEAAGISLATGNRQLATPVGYCIGVDRYFRRDDVGIIYQMNVVPGKQRSFVGATLLRAMFDRSAYGCRLYCCWCAQDIEANRFWESMGFVPLAYRAGSEKKRRVHIFWQKRIREGDTTTPWWFPSKTENGAMAADRIVLPIPMDKHWSDDLPLLMLQDPSKQLEGPKTRAPRAKPVVQTSRRLSFAPVVPPKPDKAPREKKTKVKADPKIIAAARELRDRYLERVNENGGLLPSGKYDVARALPIANCRRCAGAAGQSQIANPLLPAA